MSSEVHLAELAPRNRLLPARAVPILADERDDDDDDDYRSTPSLPPVSRRKQASVLLSSFFAIALTVGYNQCYGVFQEFYLSSRQDLLRPAPSSVPDPPTAQLAFVGTLGAGLTWAGSVFVNPLISRIDYFASLSLHNLRHEEEEEHKESWRRTWHALLRRTTTRHVTVAGVALMCAGFLLASFSHTVPQLLATQGLLYGLGSSMLYFPILAPAPEYFSAHRATAMGFMLSGGGAGGLILSNALRALLARLGAAWTLRILAAISLVVGLPVAWAVPASRFPTLPPRRRGGGDSSRAAQAPGPARRRTHLSKALLLSPALLLSALAGFTQAGGGQLPLTFIPAYSVTIGLQASTGAALLSAANGTNAAARVIGGYVGDKLGRLNAVIVVLAAAAAAVVGLWLGSVTAGASQESGGSSSSVAVKLWLAFIVIYSVGVGAFYALFPAAIADVFGIRSYAAVNGFIYFIRGCGTMVGSPIGGLLLGKGGHGAVAASAAAAAATSVRSYARVVYWDAALLFASVVCLLGLRWADAARRGWVWRA